MLVAPLALSFAVWVGAGPMAGTFAIGTHIIAILGLLFGEIYEDIAPNAARSMEVFDKSVFVFVGVGVIDEYPSLVRDIYAFMRQSWFTARTRSHWLFIHWKGARPVGF